MQIQYLYDIDGKPKFVVIPVEIWELIKQNKDVTNLLKEKQVEQQKEEIDVSRFYGILKDKNIDVEKEVQAIQNSPANKAKTINKNF